LNQPDTAWQSKGWCHSSTIRSTCGYNSKTARSWEKESI